MENELLAIVFTCDCYDAYRRDVNVESHHKPLEMIMQKPLHSASNWLQRMLFHLQKYKLDTRYKKGYLADTLSQVYLLETHCCTVAEECANIDHTSTLTLPAERVQQFQHASANDPVSVGPWPASNSKLPNTSVPSTTSWMN